MPITHVGYATSSGSGSTQNVALPTGTVAGDYLLLTQLRYGTTLATPPTNCPALTPSYTNTPAGTQASCARFIDGTEGSLFTFTNINTWGTILIAESFRGVHTTTPLDTAILYQNGTGTTHNAPSQTPVTAGAMLVTHHVNWYTQAYLNPASGMTKIVDLIYGGDLDAMSAYQLLGAAGAPTGVKGATAQYSSGFTGASLLLRPAVAGSSGPEPGRRLLLSA